MERRGFLIRLCGLLGAVIASLVAVPGVAMLVGPLRRRKGNGEYIRLVSVSTLTEGEPVRMPIRRKVVDSWTAYPERPVGVVWLIKRSDVKVEAFSEICPHAGCNLTFDAKAGRFACPCHDAFFTDGGKIVEGPSKRGMDAIPTKVEDGYVHVIWKRFRPGVAEKEPIA